MVQYSIALYLQRHLSPKMSQGFVSDLGVGYMEWVGWSGSDGMRQWSKCIKAMYQAITQWHATYNENTSTE